MVRGCSKHVCTVSRFQKRIKQEFRNNLARIPLFPVPVAVRVRHHTVLKFWWCYPTLDVSFLGARFEYRGPDRAELVFLSRMVKPGMVFFDVGAYEGLYAVAASRIMGGTGWVVIFEPSQRERRIIRANVLLNRVSGSIEPFAVSSDNGHGKLFVVTRGRTTMNSLRLPPDQASIREELVQTVTIDEYCKRHEISHIDWLKVDVEGGEMDLFKGACRVLQNSRPIIICEVLDWVTGQWGYGAKEIIEHLESYDYEWFDFTNDGQLKRHVPRIEYPEIRNYLAVPEEKTNWISEFIVPAT